MPLRLLLLRISETIIERKSMIKFPRVILDENITWRAHINTVETKITKSIGLLYKARQCTAKKCNSYFKKKNT